MINQISSSNPSTLQEWASFLSVLNGSKSQEAVLVKKEESAYRMVMHLEKQLPRIQQQPIFRRLGKHRQLAFNFS